MPKTKINKLNRKFKKDVSLTRKNKLVKVSKNNLLLNNFEKEIVVLFLEVLIMVKLFHWKTYSYATHKATDKLYSSLNEKMDLFIEILLGKVNNRISLMDNKTINLFDLTLLLITKTFLEPLDIAGFTQNGLLFSLKNFIPLINISHFFR